MSAKYIGKLIYILPREGTYENGGFISKQWKGYLFILLQKPKRRYIITLIIYLEFTLTASAILLYNEYLDAYCKLFCLNKMYTHACCNKRFKADLNMLRDLL